MSKWLPAAVIAVAVVPLTGAGAAAQTAKTAADGHASTASAFDSSRVKVSLEDRIAIQDLFARYSQAIDMGNANEMVNNVFAPNGIFHDPSLCLVGSEEIKAGLASHPSHVRTSQHWPNNIVITEMSPASDRAKVPGMERRRWHRQEAWCSWQSENDFADLFVKADAVDRHHHREERIGEDPLQS